MIGWHLHYIQGHFTISQKFTTVLAFFLLYLSSFVNKTTQYYHRIIDNVHINCWLHCNRIPGQRFEARSCDLRPDQLPFVPDQSTCTKANMYMFGKQVSVWQTSICLANEYLFGKQVSVWQSSISLNQESKMIPVICLCLTIILYPTYYICLHACYPSWTQHSGFFFMLDNPLDT